MTSDRVARASPRPRRTHEVWTQDASGEDRFTCPAHPGVALSYGEVAHGWHAAQVQRDVVIRDLVVFFRVKESSDA